MTSRQDQVTAKSFVRRERPLRTRTVRIFPLRSFLWLPIVAGAALYLWLYGTPHVLISFEYLGTVEQKVSCSYIGLHSRTVATQNGRCRFIAFFH